MLTGILLTTLAFIARSAVAIGAGLFASFRTDYGRSRRIYKIDVPKNQMTQELWTILKIIPFYSLAVALGHALNLIHYSAFTTKGTLATVAILFVWNETWFYAFHRLVHHRKFMRIHAAHHRSRITTPLTVSVFSFAEQTSHLLLAVSLPAVLSHYLPITFAGVVIYSVPMIVVNVLGHMNVEVYSSKASTSKIGKLFTTPTYHAIHHARVRGHYGLLTTIPDRLFGTFYEDYPVVQGRAANGDGLTSLNERAHLPSRASMAS